MLKRQVSAKHWVVIIICVVVLMSCFALLRWREDVQLFMGHRKPTIIADIAYDRLARNRNTDFRVYLEENGSFVPYLVLAANYGGNVLLLREHVLDDGVPFNISPHGPNRWYTLDFGAYYPDSNIDVFLNLEFKESLSDLVVSAIMPSNIVVTDKSAWGGGLGSAYASKVITRHVFLLSLRELGFMNLRTSVPEGRALRLFRGRPHTARVATFSCGSASSYWTRTPEVWHRYVVFTIGPNSIGAGSAGVYSGVRPAFALARSTPITTRTDIISGETVFVLCASS